MRLKSALVASLLVMCPAPLTVAEVSVFMDRDVWETAVGAENIEADDFSSFPDPPLDIPENESFDVGLFDVFYETAAGIDNVSIDVGGAPVPRLRLRTDSTGDDALTALELRFDPPIEAFGGAWASVDASDGITMIVDGNSIDLSELLAGSAEMGFVGFTSTTAVSSIAWSWTGDAFFTASTAAVVFAPEPMAALLSLAALATLSYLRSKARRPR